MIFYIILYICGIFLTYFDNQWFVFLHIWPETFCFFTDLARNWRFIQHFIQNTNKKYIIKYNSVQKIHNFIQPVSKKKQNLVHLRHHLKQINYNYTVFLYNLFDNLGQKIQKNIQLDLQKIHNSPKCTYFYTTFLTTVDP